MRSLLSRSGRTILFFILSFVLIFQNVYPQQYNIKNYSTRNGLNYSNITSICQDSQGFIWFGTDGGGVSRFNGKKFLTYTTRNGLTGNSIVSLGEDHSGNM